MGRMEKKICLVTGTSRGIGKAIAEEFVREGAVVYANARKDGCLLNWSKKLNTEYEGNIIPIYYDVTDTQMVKASIMKIKKEQGRIDVLVNNAAVAHNEKIGMISDVHMKEMFEVNVISVIETLQLVARVMMKQNSGSIINMASIVGLYGDKGQAAYSATKGAVISLTKSAAKELAPKHIRVNAVAPGLTDTEMFTDTDRTLLEERISHIGMGHVASPYDIAKACVFLASDESVYISGQILAVDGCSII